MKIIGPAVPVLVSQAPYPLRLGRNPSEVFLIQRSNSETLTTYTVISFLSHVAVYGFLLYSLPGNRDGWRYLNHLVTFYLAAFSITPILGIIADLTENCHRIAQCGVMLQLCGILFPYEWQAKFLEQPQAITVKMVLLGLGFGLFHTFAAATVLRRDEGHTTPLSIFLAPGILGMALVLILPTAGFFALPLMTLAAALPDNCKAYGLSLPRPREKHFPLLAAAAVVALLVVFLLQSAHLPSLDTLDPSDKKGILLLALAICAGRVLGGLLSDLIGPISLLLLPLGGALMGSESTLVSAIGIALFATSIPILMHQVRMLIPSAPGFAYGLCSFLLFPLAWISTRRPDLLPALPSPLLCGCITLIISAIVFLLLKKPGRLPAHLWRTLRPAPEATESQKEQAS